MRLRQCCCFHACRGLSSLDTKDDWARLLLCCVIKIYIKHIFRHASVSSTYPCQSVRWLVGHTFEFPLPLNISAQHCCQQSTLMTPPSMLLESPPSPRRSPPSPRRSLPSLRRLPPSPRRSPPSRGGHHHHQAFLSQSVFFQSVIIQSVFLRNVPDLRVF